MAVNVMCMKNYLTIDIGRNWLRYALISEEIDVCKTGKEQLNSFTSREDLFTTIKKITDSFCLKTDSLAITMPGIIDTDSGMAYSAGIYRFIRNEPLAREISEYTGMKTIILNDAKAAALAEVGYGSLKGVHTGVMVMLLGTGIGGAIIHDGKIFNGAHFGAGEFSYLTDSTQRAADNSDMFALSCSLNGLVSVVKEVTHHENMNILKIMFGLSKGKEDIIEGVKVYCARLANYIYNIQCVVDASTFVISGNITDEPAFMQIIQDAIDERFSNDTYQNIFQPVIRGVTFHEDARKYGAVYAYKELEKKGKI